MKATVSHLFLLFTLFSLSCATLSVPVTPNQWTTNTTGSTFFLRDGLTLYSGFWAFDGVNGREYSTGNFTPAGVPHDYLSSVALCNLNATMVDWDSNSVCNVSCCYGHDSGQVEHSPIQRHSKLLREEANDRCGCHLSDLFSYLKYTNNVGPCTSGTITGTLWEFKVKYVLVRYCFNDNIPLFYEEASIGDVFKLEFTNFVLGEPDESYFTIPSFCDCEPRIA